MYVCVRVYVCTLYSVGCNSIVGHMGVQSTIQRLFNSGFDWLHMRQHVKNFVKNCPVCQKLSAVKFPLHWYKVLASERCHD